MTATTQGFGVPGAGLGPRLVAGVARLRLSPLPTDR